MTNGKNVFVDVKVTNQQIYDKIIETNTKVDKIEKKLDGQKWHTKTLYLLMTGAFAAIGIILGKI